MPDPTTSQRDLFKVLAEFFTRATGKTVEQFAALGPFAEVVKANAHSLARKGEAAFRWVESELRTHYARARLEPFKEAANLGGVKTVLGGTSRFLGPQLASVRKMALYVDSILVPDPILPWLEEERKEERFRLVLFLEAVFWLLHLKPLIDTEFPRPPVYLFPSWEHSLDNKDATTQQRQEQLLAAFLSHHIGATGNSFRELGEYARTNAADFLAAVDNKGLFWAPGSEEQEPLRQGMESYRKYVTTWRSPEWLKGFATLPESVAVLYALSERLAPFYHLLENSDELGAQPMLCIDSHWFYYTKLSQVFEGQLLAGDHLDPSTIAKLKVLQAPQLSWLENIPLPVLADLRVQNANADFRMRLDEWTRALHGASIMDIDRVAREVSAGLSALLVSHATDAKRIQSEYQKKHKQTLVTAWTGLAASFIPSLAPFIGAAAPLGLLTKYGWDKIAERDALRRAAHSLAGVLAKAQRHTQ